MLYVKGYVGEIVVDKGQFENNFVKHWTRKTTRVKHCTAPGGGSAKVWPCSTISEHKFIFY